MNKLLISGLALAGVFSLAEPLAAHGGQYRGPGDVVPPGGGGGGGRTPRPGAGPRTPGPSGPSTPGPAGPSTPGPAGPATGGPPAGRAGPTTGGRGAQVGPDLARWQFWWEWNKDPYIRLRDAIHGGGVRSGGDDFFMGGTKRAVAKDTMRPTESQILNTVLPALKRALDSTDDRDITSSCLVAMAKVGKDHENFEILPIMREKLKENDQEIQETAALAMGISQMEAAVPTLISIALDKPAGRELFSSDGEISYRTKTFATYGLGLVAWATNDADVKRQCFEAAKKILDDDKIADRNIRVAAVNAIRLVRPQANAGDKQAALLKDCLDTLWGYYQKKLGKGDQLIQSHALTAIAQLLGRGGDTEGKYKDAFAKELSGSQKRQIDMYRSAAVALGMLAKSREEEKSDGKYSDVLLNYAKKGKDEQARYFATMALGKIGGVSNRNELLKILAKGQKATERPWAAVSLGALAHHKMEKDGKGATVDETTGRALHQQFNDMKNPSAKAGMAIGLGLCKFKEASADMQDALLKYKNQDELAGYICIGLALMGAERATEDIRSLVKTSIRRPQLLQQAAIALGKLGDNQVANDLRTMLTDENQNVAKMSAIASALGFIGDRRSIDPLKNQLFDTNLTELSRAFAAVALGGVADKEMLPWNSKIAVDVNYRAAVETLTNGIAGVLDIL